MAISASEELHVLTHMARDSYKMISLKLYIYSYIRFEIVLTESIRN